MAKVDLNTNREELLRVHKEVSNPSNATDWALFGYEGQTNVLKVVAKGDGGLEELVDELNSGKIMYAYCRVIDPNTSLPKFVLINWQGEGVPELKKGKYAHHASDVAFLLRGAHVTINARSEDDVDEDAIKDQVSKASGSNYSIHKEKPKPQPPIKPVGSVYERTVVQNIGKRRDDFWSKTKAEETQRVAADKQRREKERQEADRERKEREAMETKRREENESERVRRIRSQREAEERASTKNTANQKQGWEETQREAMAMEEERRKRAETARKQATADAQSVISQRRIDPKAAFEQRTTSQFDDEPPAAAPSRPPPRKLKESFMPQEDPKPPQAPEPRRLGRLPSAPKSPPSRPPAAAPAPAAPATAAPATAAPAAPATAAPAQPQVRNLLQENLPPRQMSDDEDNEDDWGEEDSQPVIVKAAAAAPQVAQEAPDDNIYDDTSPQDIYDDTLQQDIYDDTTGQPPQDIYDDTAPQQLYQDTAPPSVQQGYSEETCDDVAAAHPASPAPQMSPPPTSPDLGLCARALYDYQATEDNEISFDPDDVITNIDQIDEGWWIGSAPDGTQGMFPANYVELIN
ncbi:hypothetical protein NP493_1329g00028 [Ridgeia piscesae]|uniref:Coactosin-like protein n=1 Tax=Ridgeia piscesae TaxID=27915 RepID=A0AAD9K8Y3_RIDPI|nr:hypothetical protein NP493_1329g00028 [Ridgeia piscesae]